MALKTFNALDPTPPIKRYIAPLLRRRDDLALSGRWLIMKPVTHYVRGVYFDRSRSKGSLIPRAMVMPLYDEPPRLRIDVGQELKREKRAWDLRELDGEDELSEAIEFGALPAIQAVADPEAYLAYAATLDHWLARTLGEALCRFILGDIARAAAMLGELADWSASSAAPTHATPPSDRFSDLLDMMRRDPQGLIRQMHDWEAGQVRLMKLQKHWQATPFPCERGPA